MTAIESEVAIEYVPGTVEKSEWWLHLCPRWQYANEGYTFTVYREKDEVIGRVSRPDGTASVVYGAGDNCAGLFADGVDQHGISRRCGRAPLQRPVTTTERAVLDMVRAHAVAPAWDDMVRAHAVAPAWDDLLSQATPHPKADTHD